MTMNLNELPDMTAAYQSVQEKKKDKERWQDDDGDGKWYEKSDVDGKISKREKEEKKKNQKEEVEPETFDEIISELKASGIFTDKELEDLQEISADKLLDASKAADVARGKKAVAGDKEGAKKEVKRASKFYAASAAKRKQENS